MLDKSFLDAYPKVRPELPKMYHEIYDSHYQKNRSGDTQATSLSKRMEEWLHKKVAKDVVNVKGDVITLEIGAGTLNHLVYEPNIITYDVIEPFDVLLSIAKDRNRVQNIYKDISDIELDKKYERIISVATFEHILSLPEVVAKAILHLQEGGLMRVSIPNEGTVLWKMGTLLTGYEFKKEYGLDYQVLMRYEHVNTAKEIEQVLRFFFQDVKVSVMGVSKCLAFYRFLECQNPNNERAKEYLEEIQ